jgi:hypothetical protein
MFIKNKLMFLTAGIALLLTVHVAAQKVTDSQQDVKNAQENNLIQARANGKQALI